MPDYTNSGPSHAQGSHGFTSRMADEVIAEADRILRDANSTEGDVDRVVADIIQLDISTVMGTHGVSRIDEMVLNRVISAFQSRRDRLAEDLVNIGRERAEVARRHRGVAGYVRIGL
ncbi:MAG: hypothetical protein JWM34_1696 [Ilumatobacteraceae bacterium]|nr:hypothetical protein [Ilumatobacteraceae bacterium]